MKLDFTNSTRPDLLKLNEAFPKLNEMRGEVITWKALEDILALSRESSRFRTVISAWRKQLKKDHSIWTDAKSQDLIGVGFRLMRDEEQVYFTNKRYRQAGRNIVDGHAASASADDSKLTPEGRRQKDHNVMAGRHLHASVIESRRFLPKATPPPEGAPRTSERKDS